MKLTRPFLFAALFAACAFVAPVVRAGTSCPDDPERCVERGASVSRTAGIANTATSSHVATAPATATAHKPAPGVARHQAARPAHLTPLPVHSTPATPGMGMLLKLSGGMGGDVSWFPGHSIDNSGATWIL